MSKSMNIPKLSIALCEALNINITGLTALSIELSVKDCVVKTTHHVYSDVYGDLTEVIKEYQLVEK